MNREDIENRIIVCEERAKSYREVNKNFVADKYDNEKYKWEKLLSDLDLLNERKINELLDYKKAYYKQKEIIDNFMIILNKNKMMLNNPDILDFYMKIRGVL